MDITDEAFVNAMADACRAGIESEQARIRAKILDRVSDLNACSKRDNCREFARLIESYIPEWLEGEK